MFEFDSLDYVSFAQTILIKVQLLYEYIEPYLFARFSQGNKLCISYVNPKYHILVIVQYTISAVKIVELTRKVFLSTVSS